MVRAAVVAVALLLGRLPGRVVDRVGEVALDRTGAAVATCRLRSQHDLERVVGVLGPRDRAPPRLHAVDEVTQPLRPLPLRVRVGVDPPAALLAAPELPPLGRPVVAEELDRAVAAVELERGRA